MCDSIANGGPRASAAQCCPPANVVIASNVLNTTGNVIAGNVISVDGSFTGNLYVAGNIISNISYSALNVAGPINGASIWGTAYYGNGYGLTSLNASNLLGTISNTNLPPSGVVPGTYGSFANVSRVTVDQYGIVTGATNVAILSSQWTSVAGNVAYQNGVSIGTLSAPPVGSNLYVLGSANISDTLNVTTLYANSAIIFGSSTLNVLGISNLSTVFASLYIGNASGLSNLNSSNLVGNVAAANVATSVTNPSQPNITSVGTLTTLTVSGIFNSNLITGNGSAISNLNSSNLVGNVARANVALVVSQPSQPNITSVGTLSGLTISGLLVASNASGLSNVNASNLVGNVASANVALVVSQPAQPNITSVGTLTSLSVNGALSASLLSGNGSGLSNLTASNVIGTVGTAQSVTVASQPNITSLGTLTSLSVIGTVSAGTFVGDGQGIFGLHANAITETVATANSVVQPSQPNITSVGTLTALTVSGLLIASNASGLSNVNASNIVGTVGTAQSVTVAAQSNITSLGTLTSLNVSGISNLNSIQGSLISGNGSGISNINSSNLTGTLSTGVFPTSGVTAGLYGSGANVSSVTVDQYGRITGASNIAITASQWTSNTNNTIYYANAVGIGATFVPTANLHVIGNAYVSNSVTTTNIFFTNTIQATNLPTSGVTAGGYGSTANIPQIVVDQYGRLTSASNVALPATSQWTSIDANVAFGNGASIGIITNPPTGSNLYVLGTANISAVLNVPSLVVGTLANFVSANVTTGNIATANITTANITTSNILTANVTTGNIATANITTANITTSNILTANVTNLTVRTLANLVSANVTTGNIATANIVTANIVTANVVTANVTNLRVQTLANLVSANVTTGNIASANITTGNITTANIITSNIANLTVSGQENVTTLNVLSDLTVSGALTSNSSNTTLYFDTMTIPYINVTTSLNTVSIFATSANVGTLNVGSENVTTLNGLSIFATSSNVGTLNVGSENVGTLNGLSIFATNSNVGTLNVGSENVGTLNGLSIFATNSNVGTLNVGSENVGTLNGLSIFATNSNVGTLNVGSENVGTLNGLSIFATNSNVGTLNVGSDNVTTLNGLSIFATNSNVGTLNVGSENVVTLNGLSIFATNSNVGTLNVGSENVTTLNGLSIFATNSNVGTLNVGSENVVTLNGLSIFATNSNVGTLNGLSVFATGANVGALNATNLNVANNSNVSNLVVTSNILAGPSGNTYVSGNLVVAGNVFTALGDPLGRGGGYYMSLGSDIALQTPYTGTIYGTTYPLSVGLSNGWTITGTSTLITVTANGNFKFDLAGAYKLSAVFQGSTDNITGLAVGSNVADIHGTDQGYLYRYTTFVSQNPTELIEIPMNVTDASKYYYLDIWCVDGGALKATATGTGGTYLTITPLQGGGLASGGPGGTPGTQWINSGSNIYFSNSVGIGAINPAYNLDVGTGTTNTASLYVSNVYGTGANVNIRSNLYVSGNSFTASYASYQNASGFRNRLINGQLNQSYRANTVTVSNVAPANSNAWIMDRWRARAGNLTTSNASVTVSQKVPPSGLTFGHAISINVNSIASNVTGNPWFVPVTQTIEGFVGLPFYFGSPVPRSQPMVLSFSSNTNIASSMTVSVVLKSCADNTYYATTQTITNTVARRSVYIPACTIGTWNQNDLAQCEVLIGGISLGSSPVGQASTSNLNAWQLGSSFNPYSVQGVTSWITSSGGWIEIIGLQLEIGTVATPLEIANPVDNITRSMRYFETNQQIQYQALLPSGRANSVAYNVQKRNNANVLVYVDNSNLAAHTNSSQFTSVTGSGTVATSTVLSYLQSEYGFSFSFTQNNGGFNNCIFEGQFVWTADGEFYP